MIDHVVLEYFKEISAVPRGSRNNQQISDYLVQFAKEHNLSCTRDESLNVIITKEASEGYEGCPTILLQGHMDMVCEKYPDYSHDFTSEGLVLKEDGDFIFAEGTTLGGDDGISMAYALAILSDDSIIHPRLEVVITTDEEIGLLGAAALDVSGLKASYMINLDSEKEEELLVSCAGGLTGICSLPLQYEKLEARKLTITVKGLQGGHSGSEIHKNRINASLLLGRMLYDLRKQDFRIISLQGGVADNAIPREACVELAAEEEAVYSIINEVKFLAEKYKNECRGNEPDLTVVTNQGEDREYLVFTEESAGRVMEFLMNAPNGIQTMSPNIQGLVESSLNLGIMRTSQEDIRFCYSVRSTFRSYKAYMSDKLELLTKRLLGNYAFEGDYPGWEYKKNSRLRTIYAEAYKEITGREPKIEAIHAGLECGIFAEKIKDLDIISIGPDMYDIHTTEERLSMSSAVRVYEVLLQVLKDFCTSMK